MLGRGMNNSGWRPHTEIQDRGGRPPGHVHTPQLPALPLVSLPSPPSPPQKVTCHGREVSTFCPSLGLGLPLWGTALDPGHDRGLSAMWCPPSSSQSAPLPASRSCCSREIRTLHESKAWEQQEPGKQKADRRAEETAVRTALTRLDHLLAQLSTCPTRCDGLRARETIPFIAQARTFLRVEKGTVKNDPGTREAGTR